MSSSSQVDIIHRAGSEEPNTQAGESACVRPTLDYLVELTCKRIIALSKRGVLAVKAAYR